MAGFRTVAAVDNDPRCVGTLLANQRRGVRNPGGGTFLAEARVIDADVETSSADRLRRGITVPGGRR